MSHLRSLTALIVQISLITSVAFSRSDSSSNGGQIKQEDLKEWLSYIASDELEGRNTFTEGLGMAAAYIAMHLKTWGVRPGGTSGSYFQRVAVRGVKSTNRSTVTVEANGQTRTFKQGEGMNLPSFVGGKRSFTSDQIEFVGYGLKAPLLGHDDYADRSVRGKVALWMGETGPASVAGGQYNRVIGGRARTAIEEQGAIASIGPRVGRFGRGRPDGGPPRDGAPQGQPAAASQQDRPDFTSVQNLDTPVKPSVAADDQLFEFLLSGQDIKYAELKEKASKREPLPRFSLKNVKITFNLDADYQVIRTQYTRNVIGIVEGRDSSLKDTYVAFGAHYDHVGYAEGEVVQAANGPRRSSTVGRITPGTIEDRIWNGADDDGSGTVTLMAVAKAFALGQKPLRSMIFIWHAGEERGLLGSRYFADFPTVPMDKIVAQINMDMVGRNRDNKPEESNTLYAVGSDRISTDLHNLTIDANRSLAKPLALDFSFNDSTDLEQVYYRSDHYSYAAKGIPIVFLFTGLHSDYHANTDSVEKINFEKMTRVAQLVHQLGMQVGNAQKAPARDNKGPRVGRGNSGKLSG